MIINRRCLQGCLPHQCRPQWSAHSVTEAPRCRNPVMMACRNHHDERCHNQVAGLICLQYGAAVSRRVGCPDAIQRALSLRSAPSGAVCCSAQAGIGSGFIMDLLRCGLIGSSISARHTRPPWHHPTAHPPCQCIPLPFLARYVTASTSALPNRPPRPLKARSSFLLNRPLSTGNAARWSGCEWSARWPLGCLRRPRVSRPGRFVFVGTFGLGRWRRTGAARQCHGPHPGRLCREEQCRCVVFHQC